MIECIRRIAKELYELALCEKYTKTPKLIRVLREEIDQLDRRDFLPAAQYDFLILRIDIRRATEMGFGKDRCSFHEKLAERTLEVLDMYSGEGSRAETRSFDFISDADLKAIIERDYRELSLILLPDGAWKSTVVMAGSLEEAILYDVMTSDPATKSQAISSKSAPKSKKGIKDIDKDEWSLHDLIEVAGDIGLLAPERVKAFD